MRWFINLDSALSAEIMDHEGHRLAGSFVISVRQRQTKRLLGLVEVSATDYHISWAEPTHRAMIRTACVRTFG